MTAWIRSVVVTTCLAVTSLLVPAAHSQAHQPRNLVVNGDFSEDGGSLDGWTSNQNVDNFYWQPATIGTTDYASNGCFGAVCISGSEEEQNFLYQTIPTIPGLRYKLTFTYDAGQGGTNELQVLAGEKVVEDIVNAAQGSNTYTVHFIARRFDTKLNFVGRQDIAFSFLTDISVTCDFL
jgi:hypothetical protein